MDDDGRCDDESAAMDAWEAQWLSSIAPRRWRRECGWSRNTGWVGAHPWLRDGHGHGYGLYLLHSRALSIRVQRKKSPAMSAGGGLNPGNERACRAESMSIIPSAVEKREST